VTWCLAEVVGSCSNVSTTPLVTVSHSSALDKTTQRLTTDTRHAMPRHTIHSTVTQSAFNTVILQSLLVHSTATCQLSVTFQLITNVTRTLSQLHCHFKLTSTARLSFELVQRQQLPSFDSVYCQWSRQYWRVCVSDQMASVIYSWAGVWTWELSANDQSTCHHSMVFTDTHNCNMSAGQLCQWHYTSTAVQLFSRGQGESMWGQLHGAYHLS